MSSYLHRGFKVSHSHPFHPPQNPNIQIDLASLVKLTIIQKLMPSLQKEGYEETPNAASSSAAVDSRQEHEQREQDARGPQRNPINDPLLPQPVRPYPFHDPLAAPPHIPLPR